MKSTKFKLALKIVVSLFFVSYLISKVNLQVMHDLNFSISYYLFMSVFITLASLFIMSIRWLILCRIIAVKSDLVLLYKFYLKGMFFNIFLPGAIGGDIVRTKDLIEKYKVNLLKASTISIVERLSGLYVLFFVGLIGFCFISIPINNYIDFPIPKDLFFIAPLSALILLPLFKKVVNKKMELSYKVIMFVLFLSLAGQFGDIIIAFILSLYFNLSINFIDFMFIMPIIYFASVLPISMGGLGVREGTMAGLLALYGVEVSTAVILAFLMYLVKVLVGLIGWVIYIRSGSSRNNDVVSKQERTDVI